MKQEIDLKRSLNGPLVPKLANIDSTTNENGKSNDTTTGFKPFVLSSPMTKSIQERASAAAVVLNRYRIEYKNDWGFPESIVHSQSQIQKALEEGQPIQLVILAFPFKSSNRSKKVLGPLPDEAERLSLLHLNGLCCAIRNSTGSDAFLTIVSDGITYNDILGVSDQEVWRYGEQLRQMAKENACDYIKFSRICDLVDAKYGPGKLDESLYLDRVSEYRRLLVANTPRDFNVIDAIANDPDITKTYKGYKKFLKSERDDRKASSHSQTEKENAVIAKAMITRGKAFAETVKLKYPNFVRLSIHPSNDTNKVSITMLPQDNDIVMTPWHGAVVRGADGSVSMSHAILVPAMTHDIVYSHGRPSYFRERADVFDWRNIEVSFEYMYPCGIIIKPVDPTSVYPLRMVDMQKVHKLALTCSPVVLRGFSHTQDRHSCDPGTGLSCYSGIVQRTSNESNLGTSDFQYLLSQAESRQDEDRLLFASSDLFARYLPQVYNIRRLEKIKWTITNPKLHDRLMESAALVVQHPIRKSPCIRWHQLWAKPQGYHELADRISIDNGSQSLIALVDGLLLDHRVCLRLMRKKGDVLVSDNFAILHPKTVADADPTGKL